MARNASLALSLMVLSASCRHIDDQTAVPAPPAVAEGHFHVHSASGTALASGSTAPQTRGTGTATGKPAVADTAGKPIAPSTAAPAQKSPVNHSAVVPANAVADGATAPNQTTELTAFQSAPPPAPAAANSDSKATDEPAEPLSLQTNNAAAPVGGGLSLSDAIGIALANNPTLLQAENAIRRTQGEWAQVGFCPNPTAGYAGSEMGNEGQAGQQGIVVGQVFVTANKLDINRAVMSHDIAYARAQLEAQRLRVQADTMIRYYETLGAQQLVEIAKIIQGNAEQGADATQDLLAAGQSPRADLLQAQVLLQTSTVSLQQAEIQAEMAWRQLAAVMGQPHLAPAPLTGDLSVAPNLPDFETEWQRLCAASPELHAAAAQVARARARISRERATAVPDVNVQNTLQYDTSSYDTIVGLQVTLPLPVIHQNEGAISAAQAEYCRVVQNYQRQELELRARLAAAYQQLETARIASENYTQQILPAAQENLELTRAGYARGEFDLLRYLTAQRSFAETRQQIVEAQVQQQTAAARIENLLLTGGLDAPNAPQGAGGTAGLDEVNKVQ